MLGTDCFIFCSIRNRSLFFSLHFPLHLTLSLPLPLLANFEYRLKCIIMPAITCAQQLCLLKPSVVLRKCAYGMIVLCVEKAEERV